MDFGSDFLEVVRESFPFTEVELGVSCLGEERMGNRSGILLKVMSNVERVPHEHAV